MAQAIVSAVLEYRNSLEANIDYAVEYRETEDDLSSVPNDIVFKIQIAASSKSIETKPYNFKGLDGITMQRDGNLFKYFYGETSNYEATKTMIEEAKRRGYASSFVVPFRAGKKITLSEALKSTAN